jgi:hypothetical protein
MTAGLRKKIKAVLVAVFDLRCGMVSFSDIDVREANVQS